MTRTWALGVAVSMGALSVLGLATAPASAATGSAPAPAPGLVGVLGYEGGPFPGGFHPTAGSVQVEFTNQPLVLEKHVGSSGHFRIPLGPGTYTVIGCGPSSGSGQPLCGKPRNITLVAGEVDHIRLVWALTP